MLFSILGSADLGLPQTSRLLPGELIPHRKHDAVTLPANCCMLRSYLSVFYSYRRLFFFSHIHSTNFSRCLASRSDFSRTQTRMTFGNPYKEPVSVIEGTEESKRKKNTESPVIQSSKVVLKVSLIAFPHVP